MCARAFLKALRGIAKDRVKRGLPADFTANYNISPRGSMVVIRKEEDGLAAAVRRWGLIPSWAKDIKYGDGKHNARAETVDTLPTYRAAFKKHRCLVIVDGWFEWQVQADGSRKLPFAVQNADPDENIAFAGLEERWVGEVDGKPEVEVRSCSIVTTEPDDHFRKLHDRFPVILEPKTWDTWLDLSTPKEELKSLLVPCPPSLYTWHRVGFEVGKSSSKGPQLIERIA